MNMVGVGVDIDFYFCLFSASGVSAETHSNSRFSIPTFRRAKALFPQPFSHGETRNIIFNIPRNPYQWQRLQARKQRDIW